MMPERYGYYYEICDLTPVKMSMFVFWVVTPCELVHTSVSQEHTLSIFGTKDAPFPETFVSTYKPRRRNNLQQTQS
jgi:hypothetical protein